MDSQQLTLCYCLVIYPLLFLKFVYVTHPLRRSLVVHTLPKNKTWIRLQIT